MSEQTRQSVGHPIRQSRHQRISHIAGLLSLMIRLLPDDRCLPPFVCFCHGSKPPLTVGVLARGAMTATGMGHGFAHSMFFFFGCVRSF